MTLPVIGAVSGISLSAATPATPATTAGTAPTLQGASALAGEALQGTGAVGSGAPGAGEGLGAAAVEPSGASANVQPLQGPAGSEVPGEGLAEKGSGSFGSALTEAISSLEGSQRSADSASQALATGTVKDPESAVATVEDAALSMQLAAQLRTKATEAVQTIFQTQV